MLDSFQYCRPALSDGLALHQLIQNCPPLDVNSSYLYFLQSSHFADTCVVAKQGTTIVGFVSGYLMPNNPSHFFVWQVAVAETARGNGLAKKMIQSLLEREPLSHVCMLTTTISPTNKASQSVFKSIATHLNWSLSVSPFLEESHFGDNADNHEAEELYTLTPIMPK